ncbi:MAG: hypothetical protein IKT50_05215 [Clostridia bacterium]|nr:hypothetical protein [Clostridia bacterium]
MKVDIHSHILPGVDDGASDLDATRRLLSSAMENGVTHLALTPHFYPYNQSLDRFLQNRNEAFEKLLSLTEAKKISFALGAEVYLSSTLFNANDLSALCYEGTELMLVEPEYTRSFSKETQIRLRRLITDYGITPVIAHIDRYPFFMSDERLLDELKQEGCMFQANLSSFFSYFSRKKLINFYRKGYLDFLGEDIHDKTLMKGEREKLLEKIRKKEEKLLSSAEKKAKKLLFQ